jgi:hypothetical protein
MRVSLVIVVLAFTHSASAASADLACSSDSHWLIDTTLSSSTMTPYEMYPGVLVTMGMTAARALASSSTLSSWCV